MRLAHGFPRHRGSEGDESKGLHPNPVQNPQTPTYLTRTKEENRVQRPISRCDDVEEGCGLSKVVKSRHQTSIKGESALAALRDRVDESFTGLSW